MCAYRGLRNWPGSKPQFPLFTCRSGLPTVKFTPGPRPWPLPGGFEWRHPQGQWSFAHFHKSLPGREISKVHFELNLGFTWDLSWTSGTYGHTELKENWEGEGSASLARSSSHHSLLETPLVCVPSSTAQKRDLLASPSSPICWGNWKRWVIVVVVSTWGLREVS